MDIKKAGWRKRYGNDIMTEAVKLLGGNEMARKMIVTKELSEKLKNETEAKPTMSYSPEEGLKVDGSNATFMQKIKNFLDDLGLDSINFDSDGLEVIVKRHDD